MCRALGWVMVAALCFAGNGAALQRRTEARLLEAQAAFDEATWLLEAGKYPQALHQGERALALREAELGGTHLEVADCLNLLGNLFLRQENADRAAPLVQRALTIREAVLGRDHPDVAQPLQALAQIRLAQQRLDEAVSLLTRAFTLSEKRLRQEALHFSESHLTSFLQFLRTDEERIYALLRAHPDNARVRHLALSALLLRKGRSIEEISQTSRAVYRNLGAQDRDTFDQLRAIRAQLATLSLQGPGSLTATDYRQRLKELTAQGDTFEATLAQNSAPLRALTALPSPSEIVGRVASALPRDSALIEFVVYEDSQLRYLALVLFPDGRTHAFDLGSAAAMDQSTTSLQDAFSSRDASYQGPSQALYALTLRPVMPLLGNVRRLFVAPDGQLSLVSFAALHDGRRFLIEDFDFIHLTSGRDLLPRPHHAPSSDAVVVFADPVVNEPRATGPSFEAETLSPPQRSSSKSIDGFSWVPLPGTRQEAQTIQRLIPQTQLFLGPRATREQLLQLATPSVLHIASHGFFLDEAATPAGSRALGHFGAFKKAPLSQQSLDPLLRSGLVLTGARAAAAPDAGSRPPDNAVVTALELAGLDLWGTELVVLSACDTGRGDVKLGQGVYGLRRSLVIAGAETVVTSLWKVNDDSTRMLMERYYQNLLAGQGRAGALNEAMRTLRKLHPHPHHWAPFIALGRDTPLRALAPRSPPAP